MPARKGKKRSGASLLIQRRYVPWVIVAVAVLIAASLFFLRSRIETADSPIEERMIELATERGAARESIVVDDPIAKVGGVFVRTWRFSFPNQAAREGFLGDLQIEGAARMAKLVVPEDLGAPEVGLRLDFGFEAFDLRLELDEPKTAAAAPTQAPTVVPTRTPRPQPPANARGKLAILLDDAGQNDDLVALASALPAEVGVAVLPFLPKSAETATALYKAGHEVWLHLPMEPQNYPKDDPGPGAILVSMTTEELRTTVHTALNNIPHAVGVNNHMGSKATADLKTMTWIMQELSIRNMAFIDSRTTIRTVAEEAARAQGVPTNRRHVFLDNERSASAIRKQLAEAVYRSRMEGEIIAIGHLDPVTVEVLTADLPGLASRGADLVNPSDLVR